MSVFYVGILMFLVSVVAGLTIGVSKESTSSHTVSEVHSEVNHAKDVVDGKFPNGWDMRRNINYRYQSSKYYLSGNAKPSAR